MMQLRFHWRMLLGGEIDSPPRDRYNRMLAASLPDLEPQVAFCRAARECGIESLLLDFGYSKADPALMATALGIAVPDIGFIVAHRSGLMSPVAFVQEV